MNANFIATNAFAFLNILILFWTFFRRTRKFGGRLFDRVRTVSAVLPLLRHDIPRRPWSSWDINPWDTIRRQCIQPVTPLTRAHRFGTDHKAFHSDFPFHEITITDDFIVTIRLFYWRTFLSSFNVGVIFGEKWKWNSISAINGQ